MSRHGGSHSPGGQSARGMVQRLLERRQLKDALKMARANFRQESVPENRLLLEQVSVSRADELLGRSLIAEAKAVVLELLELGVTDEKCVENLVVILPSVGLSDRVESFRSRLSANSQAALNGRVADRVVLSPAGSHPAELREPALRIRQALDVLQAGDETRALELIQDIPRSSPLAEWRYFLRGLAAYQRGDDDQAVANWDRLDAGRTAHSIAAPFRQLMSGGDGDISKLEWAAFGQAPLAGLRRLRRAVERSDWREVVSLLPALRTSLASIDPKLNQQLTESLLHPLTHHALRIPLPAARQLLRNFTQAAEAPTIDRYWNRLWAVLWEMAGDLSVAIDHWKRYLEDLAHRSDSLPLSLPRMQALVWRHIGNLYESLADQVLDEDERDFDDPGYEDDFDPDDALAEAKELRGDAVKAWTMSRKLDPAQRQTHQDLLDAHDAWDEPDLASQAARELLIGFPEDVPTLEWLLQYHQKREEPEAALVYLGQLQALKPLDASYAGIERWARFTLARHFALQGHWDKARAALIAGESLGALGEPPYRHCVRKAVFEIKAKETEHGAALIQEALNAVPVAGPVWLLLAIEGQRYALPKVELARFSKALKAQLAKPCESETAGMLSEILYGYVVADVDYTGRKTHLRDVTAYLSRCQRIRLKEEDLVNVCMLLGVADCRPRLLNDFSRRGRQQYPKNPMFLMVSAQAEMSRGPRQARMYLAETYLSQALKLMQLPGSSYAHFIPHVQRHLGMLSDALGALPLDVPRFGGSPMFEAMAAAFAEQDAEFERQQAERKARKGKSSR